MFLQLEIEVESLNYHNLDNYKIYVNMPFLSIYIYNLLQFSFKKIYSLSWFPGGYYSILKFLSNFITLIKILEVNLH